MSTRSRGRGSRGLPYLLVTPLLALIAVFVLYPMAEGVWVSLYGHTSPAEFAAFNTDKEEADEDIADADDVISTDADEGENLRVRRNGHAAAAFARTR